MILMILWLAKSMALETGTLQILGHQRLSYASMQGLNTLMDHTA